LMLNTIRKTKIFMTKHLPFKPSSIYPHGFKEHNKPTKKKVQRLRFSAPPHTDVSGNENVNSPSAGSDTTSVPDSSAKAVDQDPQPASKSKDNNTTLTEKSGLQHAPTPNDSDPATADNFTRQQPLPEAVESELQHAPAPSDSDPATATANQDNIIKHQPLSEAVGSDPQPPTPSNSEPVITTGDDHNIIKQQLLPKALGTHSASTRLEDPDNSKTVDTESSTLRRRRPDPTSPSVENATMDRHTTSVVENTHLGLNFFEIPCETSIRQIIRQFVLQNMR